MLDMIETLRREIAQQKMTMQQLLQEERSKREKAERDIQVMQGTFFLFFFPFIHSFDCTPSDTEKLNQLQVSATRGPLRSTRARPTGAVGNDPAAVDAEDSAQRWTTEFKLLMMVSSVGVLLIIVVFIKLTTGVRSRTLMKSEIKES
jgi:hypothetical protein